MHNGNTRKRMEQKEYLGEKIPSPKHIIFNLQKIKNFKKWFGKKPEKNKVLNFLP